MSCIYTKQFSIFESCDYDDFVEDENGKVFKYLRKFETRGPGSKYVIADEEGKEKTVWGPSAGEFKKSSKQFASYSDDVVVFGYVGNPLKAKHALESLGKRDDIGVCEYENKMVITAFTDSAIKACKENLKDWYSCDLISY